MQSESAAHNLEAAKNVAAVGTFRYAVSTDPQRSNRGMSVTIQVRVDQMAKERSQPCNKAELIPPPHAPNAETVAAIQAAERGELVHIGHPLNLIADLDAD